MNCGFSLVEVALALAIIAFALVGIMGLIPVAMHSAQDSQRETRAALIARQIFSDLQSQSGTNRFIVKGTNILQQRIPVDLTQSKIYTNTYSEQGIPTVNNAIYLALVEVKANDPTNGLSRVQASIEVPAEASSNNRTRYNFVTLLNQQ